MKNNWQTKKLGEIIVENRKSTIKSKGNKEGIFPFFVSGFNVKKIDKYLIDDKNIFLPTGGNFFVHYFDGKASYSTDTWSIKTKEDVNIKYLYYFLVLNQDFISKKLFKGATIKHLQKKYFKDIVIFIPPISEQLRIIKILDEVFDKATKIKMNAEKNLQNSKDLFESYLQNIFVNKGNNWEKKTLKEISLEFGRGKSKHRPRNDKKLYNGQYPFIQTGDVRNCNHYITEYSQTYNEKGLNQSKLWPKGTICITIAANIAETGILNFDACFPDSVIGLVVNDKMANQVFVEYLLQFYKTYIQTKGKGSAQANINMGTFEYEKFLIPSLSEQKLIVSKLDKLSIETKKLEVIYKQKLADLEELKKSILKKAFNGEL